MKILITLRPITLFFILFMVVSCSPKEYNKIPIENLDPKLKEEGETIVSDIIKSFTHEKGVFFLKNQNYITPLVHGRIMHNTQMYDEAYRMANHVIGNIQNHKLFQVVDKRIVKTMRYRLHTDAKGLSFIELKIDINDDYNLADFYLYITTKDGSITNQNILPTYRK